MCSSCNGSGVEGKSGPEVCPTCEGRGEVYVRQGFFTMSRTCTSCHGAGTINRNPCKSCKGVGTQKSSKKVAIKIPPGIDSGQTLKLSGEGEPGLNGGPSGDLYVHLNIKTHDFFERNGSDVLCEVPVTFTQAALGSDIKIPTLDGLVKMKVPAGTQSGKTFRLSGKGAFRLGGYSRGDELVKVIVEIPTKLNKEQKELLKKLETISHSSLPIYKKYSDKIKNLFR